MKPNRHLLSAASLGLALAATSASADTWPSKPITFIVPTAPAGSTDIMARMVADPLQRALGQPIVVDNKPGASSRIRSVYVRDPDLNLIELSELAA